jgi:hypothetical protein
VDRADLHTAVGDELRQPQALRPGEREVDLARDAALEEVDVFGAAQHREQEVEVV